MLIICHYNNIIYNLTLLCSVIKCCVRHWWIIIYRKNKLFLTAGCRQFTDKLYVRRSHIRFNGFHIQINAIRSKLLHRVNHSCNQCFPVWSCSKNLKAICWNINIIKHNPYLKACLMRFCYIFLFTQILNISIIILNSKPGWTNYIHALCCRDYIIKLTISRFTKDLMPSHHNHLIHCDIRILWQRSSIRNSFCLLGNLTKHLILHISNQTSLCLYLTPGCSLL